MTWGGIAMAIASVVSAGVSYANSQQAIAAQKKLSKLQQESANRQLKQAEQDFNAANQQTPDASDLLSSAMLSSSDGQSSTMLTGPGGIDEEALRLRKRSLLGG